MLILFLENLTMFNYIYWVGLVQIGTNHLSLLSVFNFLILICAQQNKRCVLRSKSLALKASSTYGVIMDDLKLRQAFCDMKTAGGGWTVIQRRADGSVNFFRKWAAYKASFGSLTGEFWWGLENIHLLTSSAPQELRIDVPRILSICAIYKLACAIYKLACAI